MSEWIECGLSKSTPPDREEVLVFLRYGSIFRIDFGRARYRYGNNKMHDWEVFIDDEWSTTMSVTHWMPLPQPPKN